MNQVLLIFCEKFLPNTLIYMIADYDNNLINVIHVRYCYVSVIYLLNNFIGFVLFLGIYFPCSP